MVMANANVRQTYLPPAAYVRELEWIAVRSFLRDELGKNSKDMENVLELDPEDLRMSTTYGIFDKGVLVGIAMVSNNQRAPLRRLERIYVTPKCRRIGLAKYALEFLKIRSVRVLIRNHSAMQMYHTAGFRPATRQPEPGVLEMVR